MGNAHRLRPMQVVNVPTGQVHGFSLQAGNGRAGWSPSSPNFSIRCWRRRKGSRRVLAAAGRAARHAADAQDRDARFSPNSAARHYARAHVLRALSATLLGLVARALAAEHGAARATPGADLVKRFEDLLDAHFLDHWPVARYAEALKVTPTHLSRLTREAYGCPASQMIRDRMVREAQTPSRLYQPVDLADCLCAALRRPGLFHPHLHPGHRPVAARLSQPHRFALTRPPDRRMTA